MAFSQYKYEVDMSCGACSNAINKVLTKMNGKRYHLFHVNESLTNVLKGVEKVEISLEHQSVLVDADKAQGASYDAVLEKIKKTGRTVKGGETVRD